MSKFEITIEIVDILEEGMCTVGHQIGEPFMYPEDRDKFCAAAFNQFPPIYGS